MTQARAVGGCDDGTGAAANNAAIGKIASLGKSLIILPSPPPLLADQPV
jgi:hypothetical protein